MKRTKAAKAVAASVLALVATLGATAAHPAVASTAQTVRGAALSAPWWKYGTYADQYTCGITGHNLVNRDIYADYTCSRALAGWDLWVRN
ncbi:hypothetical protein ACIO93_35235 [Streptomyces sp. NPDC087903]|uniref:hypothetical protein n=1 Tax=Streptomyces sp. NPDC087903 TaxID=3365819 RepID=UPI00380F9932